MGPITEDDDTVHDDDTCWQLQKKKGNLSNNDKNF